MARAEAFYVVLLTVASAGWMLWFRRLVELLGLGMVRRETLIA